MLHQFIAFNALPWTQWWQNNGRHDHTFICASMNWRLNIHVSGCFVCSPFAWSCCHVWVTGSVRPERRHTEWTDSRWLCFRCLSTSSGHMLHAYITCWPTWKHTVWRPATLSAPILALSSYHTCEWTQTPSPPHHHQFTSLRVWVPPQQGHDNSRSICSGRGLFTVTHSLPWDQ